MAPENVSYQRWPFRLLFLLLIGAMSRVPALSADARDPRDSKSPFGVLAFTAWDHDWNDHFDGGNHLEREAALARDAGIKWVRMDFLWADIEPAPGRFDFAKYDRILQVLSRHDLHVLGILEYNPTWRKVPWNTAPDPAAYAAYAEATVHHFKDRVKYWEIWNEPDFNLYWSPQDDMVAYAELLKRVYPKIKAEDPTAGVVMGGLANSYPFHLRSLYKKAGAGYFDIVNIHPFVAPRRANSTDEVHGIYTAVRKVMDEFNDGRKPIWFTEIGCPGVAVPDRSNAWWEGESPTEKQQAQWVSAVYAQMPSWPGVEKVFWAFLRDTPSHFQNGVDYFGLLRNDFSKKPAYEAYKLAIKHKSSDG